MNKKQNQFSNKFKNFVNIAVRKILNYADLPEYKYDLNFVYEDVHDSKNSHHTVQAEIDVMPEYQNFTLTVYKDLEKQYNKGFLNEVFDVLCHEIGHVHTQKIYDLVREPYKTEKETDMVNEELSTKIGNYLYRILDKKVLGELNGTSKKKNHSNKKNSSSKK